MKKLIPILILFTLISCDKLDESDLDIPKPNYPICNVRIESIMIDPDTTLDERGKYLNIMTQYHSFHTRDSVWRWCDRDYNDRAEIHWGDHKCQFSFEVNKPDMAIEIKPATCPGVILGFDIYINDSLVRVRKEGTFFRIRLNN